MAQKLMEKAAETAIDAVRDERTGFVNESADLMYNLVVLWSAPGVAEKLPRAHDAGQAGAGSTPLSNPFQAPGASA